jgi:flagellar basal body-associated protein FliL
MINDFRFKTSFTSRLNHKACSLFSVFCFLFSFTSFSQDLTSSIDSTSIKIGEQITYKIQVETDSTDLVVFPEGQTFSPLEMIESYKVDTTKKDARFLLVKKYGLTQFDSGKYTIPRQKILIGDKTFFTDSLKVIVNTIMVDSTKQGLYDIKPIIEVEKSASDWWITLFIITVFIALAGVLLYWFLWRKKPLTEAEEIALLPPYERAKLALRKLDESHYLENSEIKEYYSELTLAIRRYIDEKVYDRALESTTDELISRLNLLKEGNQIDLSKDTLKNLESIFKRADLVKFAKSAPDIELAKLDRNTIDLEIDHVKEVLPEPTEEEKLLNQQYKDAQERKKKRRKIILTSIVAVFIIIAVFVGFGVKYGFGYVTDTLLGNDSKELLEGHWVRSEYGVPPIDISTPNVLKRENPPAPEDIKAKLQKLSFFFGTIESDTYINVSTTTFQNQGQEVEKKEVDLAKVAAETINDLEKKGVTDIFVKQEKYTTPNGAEGLKTFGTLKIPMSNSGDFKEANYVLLQFVSDTKDVLQQILLTWTIDDVYAEQISERIINSIELKKAAQ